MAKAGLKRSFVCQQCGGESPKWLGRCPECGEWNTMVETATAAPAANGTYRPSPESAVAQELAGLGANQSPRMPLQDRETDRVLGGGIVPGSLTLIGGDPGIGKSTLLLQIAQAVAESQGPVLYVSGEESPQQVKLRADRLGIKGRRLFLLAETDMEQVLQRLDDIRPSLAIIDSIQTMYLQHIPSTSGSVAQVRECAMRLMQWAKARDIPVFIAGHVTKDGAIAGPRVLEHMVDVVLYLEGESFGPYRILRGVKNRFGSTNEVGIFEMGDQGLMEVSNPSEAFLAHRREQAVGSAIVPTMEGTRPLLVEIQALVTPTSAPTPRRVANGVDFNRLLLICAVLAKHLGVGLGGMDIVVNVVGGLRVAEPAADLATAMAVLSSLRDTPTKAGCVAIGEIGLSGELRPVSQMERRLSEAAGMGFSACLAPTSAGERAGHPAGIELLTAGTLREAVRLGMGPKRPPQTEDIEW